MAEYMATTEDLKAVADSIRAKGGTSAPLAFPDGFATAVGAIDTALPTQEKTVSITENGDTTITPDVGKLLSKVIAQVNVSGGGSIDISPYKFLQKFDFTPAEDTTVIKVPYVQGQGAVEGYFVLCKVPGSDKTSGFLVGAGGHFEFNYNVGGYGNRAGTSWVFKPSYPSNIHDNMQYYNGEIKGGIHAVASQWFKAGATYTVFAFRGWEV